MLLGIALGYLVSLMFLTGFVIWNYQQGSTDFRSITNVRNIPYSPGYQSELPLWAFLLGLTLPVTAGGVMTGWLVGARPVRSAITLAVLYALMGPILAFDVDGPSSQYVDAFSLEYLRGLMPLAELYAILLGLSLFFAVLSAAMAGYLRRQRE